MRYKEQSPLEKKAIRLNYLKTLLRDYLIAHKKQSTKTAKQSSRDRIKDLIQNIRETTKKEPIEFVFD
jgi:hypothetical protein